MARVLCPKTKTYSLRRGHATDDLIGLVAEGWDTGGFHEIVQKV